MAPRPRHCCSRATPSPPHAEDDRPPIVVRSGSIYFDGGDKLSPSPKWRGWTLVSSSSGTSIWKPDHPAGAAVRAFEVIAVNAIGTSTCPLTPFLADRVDLVYAGSTKPQTASIHTMADKNNKAGACRRNDVEAVGGSRQRHGARSTGLHDRRRADRIRRRLPGARRRHVHVQRARRRLHARLADQVTQTGQCPCTCRSIRRSGTSHMSATAT